MIRGSAKRRRPLGVWIVSAFYALSSAWTLFSLALIYSGSIEITGEQKVYFASLTGVDRFFSLAIVAIGFSAAVSLFLLRRIAVTLFSVALALNILFTAAHAMRTNWSKAMGDAALVSLLLAWGILIAIILYASRLAKRGVLS